MKEYNPQGGSIPHTLLPRVASYRRQPRAIESTTPVGLSTPSTVITEQIYHGRMRHHRLS